MIYSSLENTGKLIGRKLAKGYVDGKGEVEEYLHDSRVPMTEMQLLYYFKKLFFISLHREKNYLLDLPVSNISMDGTKLSHLGPKVLSKLTVRRIQLYRSMGSVPADTPQRNTQPT